jgi:hypothetical protein
MTSIRKPRPAPVVHSGRELNHNETVVRITR